MDECSRRIYGIPFLHPKSFEHICRKCYKKCTQEEKISDQKRPCIKHYQVFRKNRRPQNKIKIVCSKSTCFSSVMRKDIRKHPVSESWICLSCYKKEVRQLEFQAETKEETPETQNPAPPEDPPGASISYEIYQEALKVYEELRKTEDLPSVAEDNFRFS
ncbi:hypothetical protein CAEBREN_24585 [Caenorhabditis brenneri]|uniref:Uncharacterized protein n=1 Tax=Caenorhabditis brenneri TaxID=135651 RepID=G0N343_CAEBE|nr:hypothetical protein CAEBREN_24585 [Caenorhabditis brenneri]